MNSDVMVVRRRIGAAFLLGIIAVARTGCSTMEGPAVLPRSDWGGDHLLLQVYDTVALTEFDCAHGRLDTPIRLLDNEFVSAGWFIQEHGGPIREGELASPKRARYSGKITGDRMTISVMLIDEARSIGTFHLQRGSSGRVF